MEVRQRLIAHFGGLSKFHISGLVVMFVGTVEIGAQTWVDTEQKCP